MTRNSGTNGVKPSGALNACSQESVSAFAPAPNASKQPIDIRRALKDGMAKLRAASVPSHTLAAELLLMHALGRDRTWLYTHPEAFLKAAEAEKYYALITRRAAGEPTQYITGKQEFWGLEFEVTPAVLIPRPETEHVMEVALARLGPRGLKIHMDTGLPREKLQVADAGTGSGCLAVSLAYELPHGQVFATDTSAPALEVARRNALRHSVADRIQFLQTDLLEALNSESHAFDLIVSNPPYIASSDSAELQREVRDHEPHAALFGGPTGVEIYPRLIAEAERLLHSGGILVLELGYNSSGHVREILTEHSCWTNISFTNDLAGIPRVAAADRL
ncbi:MAG TPA: peptide chain release factor N(5)-glutamine methyltransferase [Candidatus Acidoferrales bacterium]|nr:peptide chain release factor N(5)-glutamine methyltransferase [Candidatus Acidoferrales bacterium]